MPELQRVDRPGFRIIGLQTRTTNETEMSGPNGRIGPLWGAFMQLPPSAIPGAATSDEGDADVFAVYTNYEGDHNGAYDLIIGKAVKKDVTAPEGMVATNIPASRYLVFPAADRSPQSIINAWMSVYEYFAQPGVAPRAFTSDFEEYAAIGVSLYIAVGY